MSANWNFLTNHALVLKYLALYPQITANEISSEIGITERAVRKIIADFYRDGYIAKGKEGRRIRYSINTDKPLKTQEEKFVGDLLKVLA